MEKEKVNTKLMKSMKVGEIRTFTGRTYKEARSASCLTRQVRLTHGIDCSVKTRERVDGTYEITVKEIGMRLEKELQFAIMRTIEEGVREAMSQFGEEYVTGKELCKRFQMFTPNWLKLYGHLLPRTRAEVTEQSGESHVTGWCYPVNKIGRMIESGEIKRLCNHGRVISVKVTNGEVRAKLVINASK